MTYLEIVQAQTGLVRAFFFDEDFLSRGEGADYGMFINSGQSNPVAPVLDTSRKASGQNSIKFTIPSQSSAGSAGQLFMNLSTNRLATFGANQTIYGRFQVCFDRFLVEHQFLPTNTAFKVFIFGQGDPPDASCVFGGTTTGCAGSHSDIEMVMTGRYSSSTKIDYWPVMYNDQLGNATAWEEPFGGIDFKLQNGMPSPFCLYSNRDVGAPNCFHWLDGFSSPSAQVSRWATVSFKLEIGAKVSTGLGYNKYQNCKGSVWISWTGEAAQTVFTDYVFDQPMPNGDMTYAKFWILPYMSLKDQTEVHTPTHMWVANPMFATFPIPLTTDEFPSPSRTVIVCG